ncbi:CBS domain-containing protein [Desulfotalea psychrophila]|nr:CBS domain-containing protein [Desulfotalea psychrophila]
MYIGHIMHTDLVTISPTTNLVTARKIMDSKSFDHLLVVNNRGVLEGILSDKDLKQNWASPATTLSVYELTSLLEQVQVKSIMVKTVLTITVSTTVERAAYIMQQNNISALPVLDNNRLAGIITSTDVMGVLLTAIGMDEQSARLSVYVKDNIGAFAEIVQALKEEQINLQSIFSCPAHKYPGIQQLIFRIATCDVARATRALEERKFKIVNEYVEDIRPFIPE